MPRPPIRFDHFEVDIEACQLTRAGIRLSLQDQPFQVLLALLERPGEVVTREDLQKRIWSGDTFVDFDHSLNVAVNKVREVLGDSAASPRFVETVPRRGYRFIGVVGTAAAPPKTKPSWIPIALGTTLAVSVGAVLVWRSQPSPTALIATPLSAETGQEQEPSLSPDGGQVAYVADPSGQLNWDIYVRSFGGGPPRRLTATSQIERSPAWSPDGKYIAFIREIAGGANATLIPSTGGPERVIVRIDTPRESFEQKRKLLAWSADSKRLIHVGIRNGRTALASSSIDSPDTNWLTDPAQGEADADPAVSPSGDRIAYTRYKTGRAAIMRGDFTSTGIEGITAMTGENAMHTHPAWTSNTEIVYSAGAQHFRQLYRIPANGGKAVQLPVTGGSHSAWPAAGGGKLLYHTGHYDVNIWRTPLQNLGASGPAEIVASSNYIDHMPEFSPDGTRLAFISNRSGYQELWVGGPRGENPLQLTSFRGREVSTVSWSPAGDQLEIRAGGSRYTISAAGGAPALVLKPTESRANFKRSPDGLWLYFAQGNEAASLWRRRFTGGEPERVVDVIVNNGSWTVTKEGVWFIRPLGPNRETAIELQDPVSGKRRTIAPVKRLPMWGLTVCPDGSCVLHTQGDRFESDLMVVDPFR